MGGMKICTDVESVVAAFGGTNAMAKEFGVLPSAVSNWKAQGYFPERMHYRLAKKAEARGLKLGETVFWAPNDDDDAA